MVSLRLYEGLRARKVHDELEERKTDDRYPMRGTIS
jgi:hypothetical protein